MNLKVLVVQNNAIINNKESTLKNIEQILAKYEGETFDLIVLPEVFAIGWHCPNFRKEAEEINTSKTIDFLKNIALTFKSLIIGGSIITRDSDNNYKNTCPVITKDGKLLTTYDKMHLFSHKDSEENKFISSGNKLKIIDLGFTKIGLSICYDIRFPELYRTYSQHGVEIFINVAAWSKSKPEHWDIMHKARAIENQCYMITANQTGKILDKDENLGHSMIIDPWGTIVDQLEYEEDCLVCTINLKKVRDLRDTFPLFKDRKCSTKNLFEIEEIKIDA